jgi:hypothetical protein
MEITNILVENEKDLVRPPKYIVCQPLSGNMTTSALNLLNLNLSRFELNDIHPVPLIPDGQIAGECDLCLQPDTRHGPFNQKMVFWVYDPAEPNAEWANGIYLLDLHLCEDCAEETQNITVVHGDTVQEVHKYMTEYQPRPDDIPQCFINIGRNQQKVSTSIAYFSGHVHSCCDVCNTKLAGEQDLYQKIYIAEYRPKRRQPADADYILFSFGLCSSCLVQTASETAGPACLDWDIVDYLTCFVEA